MQSARRSGELTAESEPCTLLDWDTEFWGKQIGRVLGDPLEPELVDAWAGEHAVDCLYFLARDEPGEAAVAEDAGFRLMDVRIELALSSAGSETASLREARPDDDVALRRLARENHRITRFYADPRFPDARCDDLYEMWIARSLDRWADVVLVADLEDRPVGYMTIHADRSSGRGSLGLVGVASDARKQGLGHALVRGAVGWCREHGLGEVTVVTQGRNVAALSVFESCGFRISDVGLWFHKWYEA